MVVGLGTGALHSLKSVLVLVAMLGFGWLALPASARADEPKAAIQGVDNRELRRRIVEAVGTSDKPAENRFQAERRANDAAEAAVAVLRSEGYYDYDVVPEATDEDQPHAVVKITPGPRYKIAAPGLEWLRAPGEPAADKAAVAAIGLNPGEAGRAADVVAAEGRVVSALASQGYPDAKAGPRRVVVDHADQTVRPTFRIDAGPLVHMDGVEVTTAGRTRAEWVADLAPWKSGAVYRPELVAELERRLLETQVYDTVTVALSPPSHTVLGDRRPVVISLADRPRATVEAGAGWSTSEGFGVDAQYSRYNRLGLADTETAVLRYALLEKKLGFQIALPHWRTAGRTLTLGTDLYQQNTKAYDRTGVDLRADLKQRIGKTSFWNVGVSLEYDRNQQIDFDPRTRALIPADLRLEILTTTAGVSLDRSDDPLNPTRGWRVQGDVDPTFVTGDRSITFAKVQAQATGYLPLDKGARTVLAGRLRLGTILNGNLPAVPSDRRFYSGGGGSVRGFEYQGVGPRLPNGQPEGGLGLFETSFEVRRQVVGDWGAAAFVDAGSVAEKPAPDFSNLRASAGFGVRYRLPFAPLRADIAFPLDHRSGQPAFQLYISIGQAF